MSKSNNKPIKLDKKFDKQQPSKNGKLDKRLEDTFPASDSTAKY